MKHDVRDRDDDDSMKVLFTLHPSYIQKNNWPLLAALRRNLELAKAESWSSEVASIPEDYNLTPSFDEARRFLNPHKNTGKSLVYDIETVRATGEIICIGCAWLGEHHKVMVIPWRQPYITAFKGVWQCDAITKVGHNSESFDLPRIERALNGNGACRGPRRDTILEHSICWSDMEHGLDDLALDYSRLLPWKGDKRDSLERYCAKDVHVTGDSAIELDREIHELGVEVVRARVMRSAPVIRKMCEHGLRIDMARQDEVHEQLVQMRSGLESHMIRAVASIDERRREFDSMYAEADKLEAHAEANWIPGKKREMGKLKTQAKRMRIAADKLLNVNWNSHKQKCELLYKTLKAPEQRKFGGGALTSDHDAIVEIRRRLEDPAVVRKLPHVDALRTIVERLNEWSELDTTIGTFTSYPTEIVQPNLLLFGTGTGRLACRNPNLQNLPKRKAYSWMIRSQFVPVRKGNVFVARDYSQIEARLQAHVSGEPSMVEAFARGEDIHRKTASMCLTIARGFEVGVDVITGQERLVHKRAVYLESYGGGGVKLQRALAAEGVYITLDEAKQILTSLRSARPVLAAYREALLERVAQTRQLRTPFGRVRWFLGPSYGQVLNFPFQSMTADIILEAMCRIDERLPEGANLVLQVHDELFVECRPEQASEVDDIMREEMERPIPELDNWVCPTDGKIGPNLAFKKGD